MTNYTIKKINIFENIFKFNFQPIQKKIITYNGKATETVGYGLTSLIQVLVKFLPLLYAFKNYQFTQKTMLTFRCTVEVGCKYNS